MSKKKPSGLWWKTLVTGVLATVLAIVVGIAAAVKEKPKAVVYVRFYTGSEKPFEMSEGATMWLHETNHGLGSSPGSIKDPGETVRVYGPDGKQLPFSEEKLDEEGVVWGTYQAPTAGTYRLVADSVGQAESDGELRGRRPYSIFRTICDIAFLAILPLGLLLAFVGVILGIIRGFSRAAESGLEESSV